MPTNIEIVRDGYDAFARGDVNDVVTRFATDVEWVSPEGLHDLGIGGTRKGHQEVLDFFSRLPGLFGEMRLEPAQYLADGDHVVVVGTDHVRTPRGGTGDFRFVHIFTFDHSKVVRFEEFLDTAMVRRLLEA